MKTLILFISLLCASSLFSQEIIELPYSQSEGDRKEDEPIIMIVEEQPEFPGGFQGMAKYLKKNFKYPKKSERKGHEGTVYVQFVVEKDGSVTNVEVIKGVTPELDKEAIRVVKNMPKWAPGVQKGKKVRARFTLPIRCSLKSSKKM